MSVRACLVLGAALCVGVPSVADAQRLPNLKIGDAAAKVRGSASSDPATDRAEQRRRGQAVNATIDEIRDFRPQFSSFLMDKDAALEKSKEQIRQFRAKMDGDLTREFMAMANDGNSRFAEQAAKRADRWAEDLVRTFSALDLEEIKSNTDQGQMLARYMTFVFQLEGLQQLRKIYPDRPAIQSAGKFADERLSDFGSLAEIEARGAANYAAEVAKVRMYPARAKNTALENDFARAFLANPSVRSKFSGSKVLRVHLTNPSWTVTRHPVTGIALRRDQQANLGIRAADGKCYSYLVLFEQKHSGGGRYGRTYMRSGRNQEMLCENMPG